MIIHFDNERQAIDHLRKSDYRRLKSGFWISPDRLTKASLHPARAAVVQLAFQPVAA